MDHWKFEFNTFCDSTSFSRSYVYMEVRTAVCVIRENSNLSPPFQMDPPDDDGPPDESDSSDSPDSSDSDDSSDEDDDPADPAGPADPADEESGDSSSDENSHDDTTDDESDEDDTESAGEADSAIELDDSAASDDDNAAGDNASADIIEDLAVKWFQPPTAGPSAVASTSSAGEAPREQPLPFADLAAVDVEAFLRELETGEFSLYDENGEVCPGPPNCTHSPNFGLARAYATASEIVSELPKPSLPASGAERDSLGFTAARVNGKLCGELLQRRKRKLEAAAYNSQRRRQKMMYDPPFDSD